MAKGKKDSKEDWIKFNEFRDENVRLKKEVTKLRKLVKESLIDNLQDKKDRVDQGLQPRKPICDICGNDNLTDMEVPRADGTFTFYVCNSCGNRSAMKRKKEIKKYVGKSE